MKALLMIHGLGRTAKSFRKASRFFTNHYDKVIAIDYPSRRAGLSEIVCNYIAPVIRKYPECDFLTHSMGGIILRCYLQNHDMPNSRAVLLAPPNKGSEVIDFIKGNSLLKRVGEMIIGPSGMRLGTGRGLALNPVDIQIGVIAANYPNIFLGSTFFKDSNDGKVSVESTRLEEMRDFHIVRCSHTTIMNKKETLEKSLCFFQQGNFLGK